jgi:outer membrane protein TolC
MRSAGLVVVSVGLTVAFGSAEAGSSQSVQELVVVSKKVTQSTEAFSVSEPLAPHQSLAMPLPQASRSAPPVTNLQIALGAKPSLLADLKIADLKKLVVEVEADAPGSVIESQSQGQSNQQLQKKQGQSRSLIASKPSSKPSSGAKPTVLAEVRKLVVEAENSATPSTAVFQPKPINLKEKAPRPLQPVPAETLFAQTDPAQSSIAQTLGAPAPGDLFNSPPTSPSQTVPTLSPPSGLPGTSPNNSGIMPSQPIGPAKPGRAPDYLTPDPNPLSFPTTPEEVRPRGIQPISLQQAIELAFGSNGNENRRTGSLDSFQAPNIASARLELEQARAALRETRAALFPSIGLTGGISQSQSASAQIAEEAAQKARESLPRSLRGVDGDRSSTTFNAAVELTYNIYTGGARPARIRAAEQQVRIAELRLQRRLIVLREDVTTAYYGLQEANEGVRIQQSAVRNAQASLRDTVLQERAGLGTRFDVLRSQVQLGNAQQDLRNAETTRIQRRNELAQFLSIPPTIELEAADPVRVVRGWTIPIEQTTLLALKYSTQLEQTLVQRDLADQQRKFELAALRPRVNLTMQYNVQDNLRPDRASNGGFGGGVQQVNIGFGSGYNAALNFQWNFFDGGAARARAAQREIDKRIAESSFAGLRELIISEVRTAYAQLGSSGANISTAELAVRQADEALRLARLRFQAGVGTQTEVINAENDLTRSEGGRINAILQYNRAISGLCRQIGVLPIASGATAPEIPCAPLPSD